MFGEVWGQCLVLAVCMAALAGGLAVTWKLPPDPARRLLRQSSMCIVPGLVWASAQVVGFVFTRRVVRPPGDGLLLLGTLVGGLGLFVLMVDGWRIVRSRAVVTLSFFSYGAAWAFGVGLELVSTVGI